MNAPRTILLLIAGISSLISSDAIHAKSFIRVVAATGQRAPGSTQNFGSFISSPPAINIRGEVAFRASYVHQGPEGIWAERGTAGLKAVAINGQTAPGTNKKFEFFGASQPGDNAAVTNLSYEDDGQIAFRATLSGSTSTFNNDGIWVADAANQISLVALSGKPLPGSARSVILFRPPTNRGYGSHVTFNGIYSNTASGTDGGTWISRGPGNISLVAKQLDPVPGSTSGELFYSVRSVTEYANGKVTFLGDIGDSTGSFASKYGVFERTNSGPVELLFRTGDILTGTSSKFTMITSFNIEESGRVLFRASLDNGQSGFFERTPDGAIKIKMLNRTQVPGMPSGVLFTSISYSETSHGKVILSATLQGPGINSNNNEGLWIKNSVGGFDLIVREGQPVPGTDGQTLFGNSSGDLFRSLAINDRGQVAFRAWTRTIGSTSQVDDGIWATSVGGQLREIVRATVPFETTTGSIHTATILGFSGGLGFSDDGHLTFLGIHGSSQAIYASNRVVVPEPKSTALTCCLIATMTHVRPARRRFATPRG